jgi:ubiquinone/menaquinone biosynthesis C-methylase UbiE
MAKRFGHKHDRQGPGRPGKPSRPDRSRGRPPGPGGDRPGKPAGAAATSWDHVADWYDKLVGDEGSDYHRNVVLPAALRMLDPQPGERLLDLCCGQGVFCRLLAQAPVADVLGVDASPSLIAAARQRGGGERVRYAVADARNLGDLADGRFDGAACLMAVHDLDDITAAFRSLAGALKPGGRAVVIFMHPCFRVPRQSSWGWDDEKKTQYRRLDRYASPMTIPIATHPGSDPGTHTLFFHRPLAAYFSALGEAGLAVVACEELFSHHKSEPGGHSRGENRSRQEFPVFLALKAVKL